MDTFIGSIGWVGEVEYFGLADNTFGRYFDEVVVATFSSEFFSIPVFVAFHGWVCIGVGDGSRGWGRGGLSC